MGRVLGNVCLGVLILLLTAGAASAQLSTAELSGRVTDTSGAVLPGVTVTMTQTDTQATRTAITDADGTYVISNLPTGPYRLEVSLQGFRSYVQNGIVLQVGATPTINVSLELGNVAETITVEGRGNPATNLNLGTFGRITAIQGTPRILQFGLKYGF
jgi:hypothetical protein